MKNFLLPELLGNQVVEYLLKQPYKDVFLFIEGLKALKEVVPQQIAQDVKTVADQVAQDAEKVADVVLPNAETPA